MPDIKSIADKADIIVNGYAFTRADDGIHLPGTLWKPSFSRLEERPSGSLELILGPRFGHLPSFPLHLLLQNLEGTNFLRIFAAKKWKEDETNEVV